MIGFNPETRKLRWTCLGINGGQCVLCPIMYGSNDCAMLQQYLVDMYPLETSSNYMEI